MEKFIQDKIDKLKADQKEIAYLAYKAGYEDSAYYNSYLPKSYYGRELPQDEETSELWDRFWSEGNGELAAEEQDHPANDY